MMISELTRRFDQPSFSILREIESLIIGSCNGVEIKLSFTFREMYSGDLNLDRLAIQLALLPDVVKTANTDYHLGVHRVTSINSLCEIFNTCSFPKTLLREVDRLIRIYLTIPLTSVTAVRSFSSSFSTP